MIIENGHWSVYVHINQKNGKMYVGITSKTNPQERWRHGHGYNDTPHFKRAISKYGWDNFDHVVIGGNLTEEEACNMEKLLIRELDLLNDAYGYNISEGGNTGCRMTGERHPMYGRHHSEETKERIRQKKLGVSIIMPEEAKRKISNAMLGNKNGPRIKVRCIETGIVYESAAEAQRQTGADATSISRCMHGKAKQTHGLHWEIAA